MNTRNLSRSSFEVRGRLWPSVNHKKRTIAVFFGAPKESEILRNMFIASVELMNDIQEAKAHAGELDSTVKTEATSEVMQTEGVVESKAKVPTVSTVEVGSSVESQPKSKTTPSENLGVSSD